MTAIDHFGSSGTYCVETSSSGRVVLTGSLLLTPSSPLLASGGGGGLQVEQKTSRSITRSASLVCAFSAKGVALRRGAVAAGCSSPRSHGACSIRCEVARPPRPAHRPTTTRSISQKYFLRRTSMDRLAPESATAVPALAYSKA